MHQQVRLRSQVSNVRTSGPSPLVSVSLLFIFSVSQFFVECFLINNLYCLTFMLAVLCHWKFFMQSLCCSLQLLLSFCHCCALVLRVFISLLFECFFATFLLSQGSFKIFLFHFVGQCMHLVLFLFSDYFNTCIVMHLYQTWNVDIYLLSFVTCMFIRSLIVSYGYRT